ncbi:MAG: alpha/beta hydrolase [Chloroflexi bacterium]|nr:alpha/beta hydrolase [Chloroflexota bacterium]
MPVVLVHGVTSSFRRNFYNPGWVTFLTEHGFRVIGMDLRGHGESEKLYDSARYRAEDFRGDVIRLLDHLALDRVHLLGYSMGGYVALDVASAHPECLRKVVCGGIGDRALGMGDAVGVPNDIAAALEAPDANAIADPVIRQYRLFAEQTGSDIRALRAIMRGPFWAGRASARQFAHIGVPTLIFNGERDGIAGSAQQLAATIPDAELVLIPERNHFTTVGDRRSMEAVLEFLTEDGGRKTET